MYKGERVNGGVVTTLTEYFRTVVVGDNTKLQDI